jgi:hypothetical protein
LQPAHSQAVKEMQVHADPSSQEQPAAAALRDSLHLSDKPATQVLPCHDSPHDSVEGPRAMSHTPSRTQIVVARLVIALSLAYVVFGLVIYGVSSEVLARIWHNLLDRPAGSFAFRFILQPIMATVAALRDGIRDARSGRAPFLRTVLTDPAQRRDGLDEALIATSRIVLLGLAMDTAYQLIEFKTFHPVEALIIALLLGVLPYLVLRGLVTRIARRRMGNASVGRAQ